jgi:FlaA1/EpsC-like NDP-sugar epimerase
MNRLLPVRIDPRSLIAIGYDVAVAIAAWTLGFLSRWNFSAPPEAIEVLLQSLVLVLVIEFACFLRFGLYRGIWRYASMHDMKRIITAVTVSALLVPLALLLWRHGIGVPRTLLILNPVLLVLFMGGGRILYRWWKEHRQFGQVRGRGRPVLLLGVGDTARRLAHDLERSSRWTVIGMLDEDARKVGRDVGGVPIVGTWAELSDVAERTGCRHAILATPGAGHATRRRVFELCERAGVTLLVLPGLDDLIDGGPRLTDIRHVELDDLLGREPVSFDVGGLTDQLRGTSVLVTGAAGSIGSELCRQIARFAPRQLIVLDQNEFGLYQSIESLSRTHPQLTVVPVIGDVKDRRRLTEVFRRFAPEVVFHAAAYKHVPMLEGVNAWEGVRNNALGTRTLGEVAASFGVTRLVFISTDKAVNPTNTMGASKRLAELILQWQHLRSKLPVVIVRFGNVLGSSGSVIPKFREQIARGGPVTVTHPDMTRYFMSIPEAARLVLQAGSMGRGGEIFVLDMGEPVRIVDLARDMIRLSGFTEEEMPIEFSGIRPGEKLFEELLASDETTLPTRHPKLRISRSMDPPDDAWHELACRWLDRDQPLSDDVVRGWLKHFVPEYAPPAGLGLREPDPSELAVEPRPAAIAAAGGGSAGVRLTLVGGGSTAGAPGGSTAGPAGSAAGTDPTRSPE